MKDTITNYNRIELLIDQNEYEKALSMIEVELVKIKTESEKNKLIILKNKAFLKMGEYINTLEFINLFLIYLKDKQDIEQYLDALLIKIECLWQLGYHAQAIHFIEEGEDLCSIIKETKSKTITKHEFDLNNHKGIVFWKRGELSNALIYLDKSLDIANELNDINRKTRALNNLGLVYQDKGNLDKSLQNFLEVLAIQNTLGNKQSSALILNNIGTNYRRKGEYDLAISKFHESREIFESLGHNKYLALIYNNLGYVYSLKGGNKNLQLALEFHEKSLKIREQLGDKPSVATSFVNLGFLYEKLGQIEIAKNYYMKSLTINQQFGRLREIAECLYNLAILSLNYDEKEISKDYLQQLKAIYKREPNAEIKKQIQEIERRLI